MQTVSYCLVDKRCQGYNPRLSHLYWLRQPVHSRYPTEVPFKMVKLNDGRLLPGSSFHTKARALVSNIKYGRLYEFRRKTRMVSGTVVGIENVTKGGRFQRMMVSKWEMLDGPKQLAIHLSSVREINAPPVED